LQKCSDLDKQKAKDAHYNKFGVYFWDYFIGGLLLNPLIPLPKNGADGGT